MAPRQFPLAAALALILALATAPALHARQSRAWDFENDAVGQLPPGWAKRAEVTDFTAAVRQEPGNRYLHLESHQDEGCPAVATLWGSGRPSPDWILAGAVQFRIRFNRLNPQAFIQLRGNLPANGQANDDSQLFIAMFQPGPGGLQAISAVEPTKFGLATGQWHSVRIQFRGVRKALAAEDPYSRGSWRLSVGEHSAEGELGQAGIDLPYGNLLNSVSFGKWFSDPIDLDLDDVRIISDADPLAVTASAAVTPPPAAATAAATAPAAAGASATATTTTGPAHAAAPAAPKTPAPRPPAPPPEFEFEPAPAAMPDRLEPPEEPAAALPPPPAAPANLNQFLNRGGGPSVLTGFIRSRVTVDAAGAAVPVVVFEVARKKPNAAKVPAQLEMRPGLWEGTGLKILLKNYTVPRDIDDLIRVRVVETHSIKGHRTFVVTGVY